jgi:hypothetical protein
MFATKSSARNNQDWRFVNCRWDGVRPNFERIGAVLPSGGLATTGSDFAKRVILDGCEITGVMADGGLYVYGCDDVTAIAPWVHDTGQDLNSGECIKVAAGARNFRLIGGLSEWGARDGIDCYDAIDAKIDGFESRHNQVNGLEVKWAGGATASFNNAGRHSIRMRSWNNGVGANISTRFTDISITAIANRSNGLRVGGSFDNNDQTTGVNIYQAIALGNDGVGVLLTNQNNLNGAHIQSHGNGLEGINIQGASSVDVNYQAFGNSTTGCHVYTGSTKVYLRGHSQDADGVATVDATATGIVRNGYGEETVGTGGQPTSTLWPSGTTVKNLTDGSVWRRTFGGWDNIGIVGLDLQGWGYPMTCEPGLASTTGVGKAAKPGTQKATSGSVACPAVGYAEVSLGASIQVNAGDFIGFSVDNATVAIRAAGGTPTTTALSDGAEWAGGLFPCPSAVGTLSSNSGRLPVLVGVA